MDVFATLAEIARVQRRQAQTLDRMTDQLEKLERLLGEEVETAWELADSRLIELSEFADDEGGAA